MVLKRQGDKRHTTHSLRADSRACLLALRWFCFEARVSERRAELACEGQGLWGNTFTNREYAVSGAAGDSVCANIGQEGLTNTFKYASYLYVCAFVSRIVWYDEDEGDDNNSVY